jgi:signal transduction histidine kinase
MTRIVQDLLLLARSDSGQLSPQRRNIPVEDLFRNAVNSLPARARPPIHLGLPPEPWELVGDEAYLTRLLVNLLENAVRHTPHSGEVTLSAHREGSHLILQVEDTGEGISPEHLPHVCERFYRVDNVRTGGRGGTGLGLAICESIVQAHGGKLSIQSRPGEGTTVRISLPRALFSTRAARLVEAAAR